jgi:hypothetical protein
VLVPTSNITLSVKQEYLRCCKHTCLPLSIPVRSRWAVVAGLAKQELHPSGHSLCSHECAASNTKHDCEQQGSVRDLSLTRPCMEGSGTSSVRAETLSHQIRPRGNHYLGEGTSTQDSSTSLPQQVETAPRVATWFEPLEKGDSTIGRGYCRGCKRCNK